MTSILKNIGENRKETWSNLPILLLWMIKDKLALVENLMVAAVCKHWHYASKIYHAKELQGAYCRSMWLMHIDFGSNSWTDQQIINFSTGKKYFVGSPHVGSVSSSATMVLCSEKGWLLLATPFFSGKPRWSQPSSPMFLVNPFTKQWYDLPTATAGPENELFFPADAAISTVEGIPHCVVIGKIDGPSSGNCDLDPLQYILKISQPNGKEWRTYKYRYGIEDYYLVDCWPRVLISNNHVYLIDRWGRTLAFDIIGEKWTSIVKKKGELDGFRSHIVVSDGAITRIVAKWEPGDYPKVITHFLFHKLNNDEGKWVSLDDNELEGRCWYFARWANEQTLFVAKESQKKEVYILRRANSEDRGHYVETYTMNTLAEGSAQMISRHRLDLDSIEDSMIWVDLG